jgi:hypothetical protein
MAETQEAQVTGLTSDGKLTPAFMRMLFLEGVLGTKEFRSWLAAMDNSFEQVRDADVDNEIDRIARERQANRLEEDRQIEQEALLEAERERQQPNE